MKTSALLAAIGSLALGMNASAVITYVDADLTTTTLADGTPLVDGTHYLVDDVQADGLWDFRSFGNGDNVFSTNTSEDTPMLRVTIAGLTAGESYNVYGFTWNAVGTMWRLRGMADADPTHAVIPSPELQGWNTNHFAGSSFIPMDGPLDAEGTVGDDQALINGGLAQTPGSSGSLFTNDAQHNAVAGDYFTTEVEIGEGNRSLTQLNFSDINGGAPFVADANGEIWVYIDNLENQASSNNRTFFDGVGYELATSNDPADLDGDGDVDDADFGIAFAAFTGPNNGPSSNPAADLDGDNDVDDADFGIAFAAFTGPGGAAVPEPASLALLGLGGLLIARRRR